MKNLLADIQIAPNGGFTGFGKLGLQGSTPGAASFTFKDFISMVIGVMTVVAFIWFIFIFITGAIGIISSGGDKGALESARKRIINGLIGVVMVIASIYIIKLLGYLIGVPDILNFPSLFSKIGGLGGTIEGSAPSP